MPVGLLPCEQTTAQKQKLHRWQVAMHAVTPAGILPKLISDRSLSAVCESCLRYWGHRNAKSTAPLSFSPSSFILVVPTACWAQHAPFLHALLG